MKLYFFLIKYIFIFSVVILNAHADIKISYEDLDFLIRIGGIDKFLFSVKNYEAFDGMSLYKEDGTAMDEYKVSGWWGVSYRVDSFNKKRFMQKNRKRIRRKRNFSSVIIIYTTTYTRCSCDGASTVKNWQDGKTLDETCFKKYLSHIDQTFNNLKNKYECDQADFFRYVLITNLEWCEADIYISNKNKELLDYLRFTDSIKDSISTSQIRDILSYVPFQTNVFPSKISLLEERFNENLKKLEESKSS